MLNDATRTLAIHAFATRQWHLVVELLSPHVEGSHDVDVLRMHALGLAELGRRSEALHRLSELATRCPELAVVQVNLASLLRRTGHPVDAEAALRRAVALDPTLFGAAYNLGLLLKAEARLGEALAWLRTAAGLAPRHDRVRVVLGEVLKGVGDIQSAVANFRQAIALREDCGSAWWGIANLKTQPFGSDDISTLHRLWRETTNREDRELIGFARAAACMQLAPADAAWAALIEANAFVAERRRFDRATFHHQVRDSFAALQSPPPTLQLPVQAVFIVGLPRSGSTLLEQMLGAHPQIEPASELPDLPVLRASEQKGQLPPDQLGPRYLERTARWRVHKSVHIDKWPENFLHVPRLVHALPQARVIDCRRDARDTALSCFQQYFALGSNFSFDLDDIACYHAGYRQLMDQARESWPQWVLRVDYEHLVARPEGILREVLKFLGLPWAEACLHPERVRREVRTASAAQVVEPLDQRGIGRWRRFERELAGWDEQGFPSGALT